MKTAPQPIPSPQNGPVNGAPNPSGSGATAGDSENGGAGTGLNAAGELAQIAAGFMGWKD